MRAETELLNLPNEVLLKIFHRLPRHDIFFGIAHVNYRFRSLVQTNLKTLRLFDAHCHVNIVDNLPLANIRNDGTDPIITYSFTLFDRRGQEFAKKRRLCLRGNDVRYKELHVSHFNDSTMQAQFERAGKDYDLAVLPKTAKTLLSYMNLHAIRFQVRKQCKMESKRIEDDFFADCLKFCGKVCGQVDIKSLLLCSKNSMFPWQLGQKSLMKLSELKNLQNLILENMTTFDPFSQFLRLPTQNLNSLQFRLDPRHRMDIDRVSVALINGNLLKMLASSAVYRLDFSAYTEVSQIVSSIDAIDMCHLIQTWYYSPKPWIIKEISFNSTVTIDEFRMAVFQLLPPNFVIPVPYCRFQTIHKISQKVVLEVACYTNGTSTQWIIRTGYIDSC